MRKIAPMRALRPEALAAACLRDGLCALAKAAASWFLVTVSLLSLRCLETQSEDRGGLLNNSGELKVSLDPLWLPTQYLVLNWYF